MNLTKEKPPLKIGDRYVALPGSDLEKQAFGAGHIHPTHTIIPHRGAMLRLDERHPCGACEFVVVAIVDSHQDDGA